MRASLRIVVAAVVVVGSFIEPAWAQRAIAELDAVVSGRIDNPSETAWEEREMCLDAGLYVLAFARGSGSRSGAAIVGFSLRVVDDEVYFDDPSDQSDVGEIITIAESSQRGWGWLTFNISEDDTCLPLAAVHGRARVYQLAVGVDW